MSEIMRRLYSAEYDFDTYLDRTSLTYLIATVPRSGSTSLCINLWSSGGLGAPLEYINGVANSSILDRISGGEYSSYWNLLKKARTSPNGVFAFKAFVQCFTSIAERSPDLLSQLYSDQVIYLTREDKVAQAISYARAAQTKHWFSDAQPNGLPDLSARHIEEALEWISRQEQAWERLFALTETTPLRVSYEETQTSYSDVLHRICRFLGVDVSSCNPVVLPRLSVQRDNLSTYLHQVFSEDIARRNTRSR